MRLISKVGALAAAAVAAGAVAIPVGTSASTAAAARTYSCSVGGMAFDVPVAFTLPELPTSLPADAAVPALPVTAAITLPQSLTSLLSMLTSMVGGDVSGDVKLGSQAIPVTMTVPSSPVDPSADQVLNATGTLLAFTAPDTAGTYDVALPTTMSAALVPSWGAAGIAECTLAGVDARFESVIVTGGGLVGPSPSPTEGGSVIAGSVMRTYSCSTAAGTVDVPVDFDLPDMPTSLLAGSSIPAMPLTATMTLPQSLTGTLSLVTSAIGGPVTGNATLGAEVIPVSLTVPSTPLHASADQVLSATGTISAFTAPTVAGEYDLALPTSISAALVPEWGAAGVAACTLGAPDARIGSVAVSADDGAEPSGGPSTEPSAGTSTEPSDGRSGASAGDTGSPSAAPPKQSASGVPDQSVSGVEKKLAKDQAALKKAKKAYKKAHGAKKVKLHKKIVKLQKAIKKDKHAVEAGK